mmetsp:Transcript_51446/g.102206  ORF Transcript_51446/g.102206 Transcript_51446/m.102206 type:complete len:481 (+) Transcript_51446:55-1497(+)
MMVLPMVVAICFFAWAQADECSSTTEACPRNGSLLLQTKKKEGSIASAVEEQHVSALEDLSNRRAVAAGDCKDLGDCGMSWCSVSEWARLHCCKCGGGHQTIDAVKKADQDLLTVMTYNTYLLRINIVMVVDEKPNLDIRAKEISDWFQTLQTEEVPDVLVLQEIYASEGQDLLTQMCNKAWRKNSGLASHPHHHYLPCDVPNSPFGFATTCVNPTAWLNPVKTGGVVVLLKKGLELVSAEDVAYDDCSGLECFTKLGFWAIKLRKGDQIYWAFGTHAIAYEDPEFIKIRQKQFKQMRQYIDNHVENGARLVIAGDMNIFTGPYQDEKNVTHTPAELEPMLANLGSADSPATVGELVPRGFWLPLASDMKYSADPVWNHIIRAIPDERRLGAQRFDSVIAPGPGDRLTSPETMRFQIVPVKSDDCFVTEQVGYPAGTKTDDLSDHYAVFAELRYSAEAPRCAVVHGHQGSKKQLPAGPTC